MPTATLTRFREDARVVGAKTTKRQAELLEKIRSVALAVIELASETATAVRRSLEDLLTEIRTTAEELRGETEAQTATKTFAHGATQRKQSSFGMCWPSPTGP
jgi:hypothetical protein